MQLRDGRLGQRALFAALVAVALCGLALAVADKLQRIGTTNVGWLLDDSYLSPTRADVSDAGLRGGGRALRINGLPVPPDSRGPDCGIVLNLTPGATNVLEFRALTGGVRELTVEARPWTAHDFLFTQGATDVIGLLFLIIGVSSFALRPYEAPSWALLALSCFSSGALVTMYLPIDASHPLTALYFLSVRRR
jgi:hypothetical protein